MKLKCVAIDDEPRALQIIEEYVDQTPFLELNNSFRNPLKGFEFLKSNKVDVLFLDINMPNFSGIQLIKTLSNKPLIILTTAYSEYAVESYELDVLDYLLKPIEFDRFLKAVNKAFDELSSQNQSKEIITKSEVQEETKDYLFVKDGTKLVKVGFDEIFYIEGAGNYQTLYLKDKKILSLTTMNDLMNSLDPSRFARVHKSYIVNLKKIKSIENHRILIGGQLIPISESYRNSFYKML